MLTNGFFRTSFLDLIILKLGIVQRKKVLKLKSV